MGELFRDFAPYQDNMTTYEEAELQEVSEGGIEQINAVHENHAINHMQSVLVSLEHVYLGENEVPGIDTYGKHSQVEMRLAQRLERVKHSFAMQNPETKALVNFIASESEKQETNELIHRFNNLELIKNDRYDFRDSHLNLPEVEAGVRNGETVRNALRCAYMGMKQESANVQMLELVAKYARVEEVSEKYENWMDQSELAVRTSPYETIIACAEYATGLRVGSPIHANLKPETQILLDQMGITHETLEKMNLAAQSYQLDRPLSQIEFNMVDATHMAKEAHFANPRNWNKRYLAAPNDFEQEDVAEELLTRSAVQSAANAIDPLFAKREERINRTKLIIVGGKTVEEIMREEHAQRILEAVDLDHVEKFETYFKDNYERDTNRIIAAGLAADKRVEVFIPNKEGKVSNPIQVVKKGEEPTPLTPVAYHGWHKFMSRFGFYQDSMRKHQEYEDTMKKREVVLENVREAHYGPKIQTMINMNTATKAFVESKGDYVTEANLDDLSRSQIKFSYSRTAIPSLCATALLLKGHSPEDIFNPQALKEEKRQIGTEFVNHAMENDHAWFANIIHRGEDEWLIQTSQRMPSANELEKSSHIGTLSPLSLLFNDLHQEASHVQASYDAIPKSRLKTGINVGNQLVDVATKLKNKKTEVQHVENIVNHEVYQATRGTNTPPMSAIVLGQVTDKIEEKTGKGMIAINVPPLNGVTLGLLRTEIINNDDIQDLDTLITMNPKVYQNVRNQVKEGSFMDNFKVDYHMKTKNEIQEVKVSMKDGPLKEAVTSFRSDMEKEQRKIRAR